MRLLITGGQGLIGSRFVELNPSSDFRAPLREDWDITDKAQLLSYLADYKPDTILHLAAYTDTAKAETERELAHDLNVNSVKYLIEYCLKQKCYLVFLSSDFTFSGDTGNYGEDDLQEPKTYYGETKLEAERLIKSSAIDYLIIRTSYPYRADYELKTDSVRWMIPKLSKGEKLHLVKDQFVTPTFVDDLVVNLHILMSKKAKGVYHLAGSSCISFLQLGKTVCKVFGFDHSLLIPTSLEEFKKMSGRTLSIPQKSCLNCNKVREEYGIFLSDIQTGLESMKRQMEAKK